MCSSLVKSLQKALCSLLWIEWSCKRIPRGRVEFHVKRSEMLVRRFELNPSYEINRSLAHSFCDTRSPWLIKSWLLLRMLYHINTDMMVSFVLSSSATLKTPRWLNIVAFRPYPRPMSVIFSPILIIPGQKASPAFSYGRHLLSSSKVLFTVSTHSFLY